MLTLSSNRGTAWTQKKSRQKKNLQNLSILFYHVVLPGNIASNLRLRTTRCLPKWRDSSEKKNTLRTPSLLHNVLLQGATMERTIQSLTLATGRARREPMLPPEDQRSPRNPPTPTFRLVSRDCHYLVDRRVFGSNLVVYMWKSFLSCTCDIVMYVRVVVICECLYDS